MDRISVVCCHCLLVRYNIYQSVRASSSTISKYDLPPPDRYREFFHVVPLDALHPLSSHCSYFSGCVRDHLIETITSTLPRLLEKHRQVSASTQSFGLRDMNSPHSKTNEL